MSNDEQEVALYSISSHPLNSYEFCVGGRDNIVRTYDQRQTSASSTPLNTYHPFKVWCFIITKFYFIVYFIVYDDL